MRAAGPAQLTQIQRRQAMSYDLNFWKEKPGVTLDPLQVYERLCDGHQVDGLEELPIGRILQRVREKFSAGWTQLDPVTWEAPKKAFQVYTTPQLLRVDCGGLTAEDMNAIIDIGLEFGCRLYDPQTGVRFEG
jgi:hypothetical protein